MKKLLTLLMVILPVAGFCDTKISNLPATTSLQTTDVIPVVTTPGSVPANKIITFQNLQNSMVSTITASGIGAIKNTETLQSGATFYVSSATVSGQLIVNTGNTSFLMPQGSASGGTGYLWARGNSAITPTRFDLVYSALVDGTTISHLLFNNASSPPNVIGWNFQNGSGTTVASISTSGGVVASTISVSSATFTNVTISGTCTGAGCASGGSTSGLTSTQTWSGQNNWTTPAQSTFTYGLTMGSATINGTGNGNIQLTISGSTYSVTSSSSVNTVGHLAVWSSTSQTLMDGGVPSSGSGSGSGTIGVAAQYQVPFYSVASSSNVITSSANFTNTGTTVSINSMSTIVQTNVTTVTASGVIFNYTSTGTFPALSITANGTYGTVNGSSGGFFMDCTGGGGASGMCMQVYSNAGTQTALGGMFNIININPLWNEPALYIQRPNGSLNNSDILVDANFTPAITIRETSQTNPSAEKWQYTAHNGVMRFEDRANDDSAFVPYIQVSSKTFWNDIYVGPTYGNQSNIAQWGIQVSTGNTYALTITTTTGNVAPYLISVSTSGALALKGSGVPGDSQALCLLSGQLGHCTTVVGAGGGCTCVSP